MCLAINFFKALNLVHYLYKELVAFSLNIIHSINNPYFKKNRALLSLAQKCTTDFPFSKSVPMPL